MFREEKYFEFVCIYLTMFHDVSSGVLMSKESPSLWDAEDFTPFNTNLEIQVHPALNIIHPVRYAERIRDPKTSPPNYLRQAMWALAATTTELYSDRCEALYLSSRRNLEEDELKNPGMQVISLAPAQTWTLIAIYELNHGYFHRAWMSTSRAVRLVQMMRLHRLDAATQVMDPTLRFIVPPPDMTEAEERRRVFWLTYIMDRSSCISMGFPSLIDERDVCRISYPSLELQANKLYPDSHVVACFECCFRNLNKRTSIVSFRCIDHPDQRRSIFLCCSGCLGFSGRIEAG